MRLSGLLCWCNVVVFQAAQQQAGWTRHCLLLQTTEVLLVASHSYW